MDSLRSVATLGRRKDRCEPAHSTMRSNMGFADTTSLESIFSQLGVSPSIPNRVDSLSRSKTSRSSEPRILKVARKSFDTLDVETPRQHERHLKINPELLAQQITLIELKLFQAIQPEEFLSLKWNSKEKMTYAPNIVASTRWFNQIIFWVQKDLLREESLPRRAEVLSHFVRIAKKLVEINNYSSAMAVVSGLLVQSVYRLSATWAALSSRDRSSFRKLADLFSQDQNFINLRTAVDTARLPCIPYLGVYLSDLTFIDVAAATVNQHENGGSWGRYSKENRLNNLLRIIANFQQSSYPFVRDEKIASYLESQRYIEELQRFIEDNNYKLSLRLEPPSGETFAPAQNDSTYPFPIKTNWFSSGVLKPVPVSNAPSDSGSLDRRPQQIPSQEFSALSDRVGSRSLAEMHSSHSSPAHSLSHGHRAPIDGYLPVPIMFPPRSSITHTKSVRDRSTPQKPERYSHDPSLGRLQERPSARHRRLGSWTAMGYSLDIQPPDVCPSRIAVFLNDFPSQLDGTMPNSSWSGFSVSANRNPLTVDRSVPVQQPLGPLLDQTDLVTAAAVPNASLTMSSTPGYNQDAAESSSSEAASGSSSTRSNRPKALTVILPNQPRVPLNHQAHGLPAGDSTCLSSQLSNSTHEVSRSHRLERISTSYISPRSCYSGINTPAGTTVESPTTPHTRIRPSVSQPRTLLQKSVSDRRVRTSPNKGKSGEHKSRACSNECTTNSFLSAHSERTISTRQSDSINQETKDCFQDTSSTTVPDALVATTLQTDCSSQKCHPCVQQSSSIQPFSSSDALFLITQPHSADLTSVDELPKSVVLSTTISATPSHLAQAALAAVQGTVADELARLSGTDSRNLSLPRLLPRQSNLISPTKAVCLDVQFANGLRVLREGAIRYQKCSKSAFRRVQLSQNSPGLNKTVCTRFGSCDALDAFQRHQSNRNRLNSFSCSSRADRQTSYDHADELDLNSFTHSPSNSLSRVSLTSFALDLPLCSTSSSNTSSLSSSLSVRSVSGVPSFSSSSSSSGQASLPPGSTTVKYGANQPSVIDSGKPAVAVGKHSLANWFHRLLSTGRRNLRTKLRWGVLIQSDAHCSPAFLVLFKLHSSSIASSYYHRHCGTSTTVELLTQSHAVMNKKSSGINPMPDPDGERLLSKAYTPEMFCTSRCQVLAIGKAVMDCRSSGTSSVLIADKMGIKRKLYRLLSASCGVKLNSKRSYDALEAILQRNFTRRHRMHRKLFSNSPNLENETVPQSGSTLSAPRARRCRTPGALKPLKRIWPATWTAARRLKPTWLEKPDKPQVFSPQTTPTSRIGNPNETILDQINAETHLLWLPLLTLFPDEAA